MEKENHSYYIVRDIYRKLPNDIIEIIKEKQAELEEFINRRLVPISKK